MTYDTLLLYFVLAMSTVGVLGSYLCASVRQDSPGDDRIDGDANDEFLH